MTRDEIMKKIQDNRATIRGSGAHHIGILGYYARGEQREVSDMDFLVESDGATSDDYCVTAIHTVFSASMGSSRAAFQEG